MANATRANNLYLARFLVEGLSNLTKALNSRPSESTLIRQGQGKKTVSNADAIRYASDLALAKDWFDRDNEALLRLSDFDYEVVMRVLALSEKHKAALSLLLAR